MKFPNVEALDGIVEASRLVYLFMRAGDVGADSRLIRMDIKNPHDRFQERLMK